MHFFQISSNEKNELKVFQNVAIVKKSIWEAIMLGPATKRVSYIKIKNRSIYTFHLGAIQ